MKLTLTRDYRGSDCTLGQLHFSSATEDFNCHTIERPWIFSPLSRGGAKGASCVPEGVYRLERHNSEAHPNTWALVNHELDVYHFDDDGRPNVRALVLIHVANFARELRGCIAPGFGRSMDDRGTRMVTNSRRAMIDFKRLLPWTDDHTLEVK